MILALVPVGLVLLALPGIVPLGRRLDPAVWARAMAMSLTCGVLAIRVGLLLTAVPAVIELVGVHPIAHACHHFLGEGVSTWVTLGWLSGAMLLFLEARAWAANRRIRVASGCVRIEGLLGHHEVVDTVDIVTLATDDPIAYSVDGRPGQVVVTTGLRDALTSAELAAVVDHERSHLRNGHCRWLRRAARLEHALGWLPPVRRSVFAQRLALERWADEDAASSRGRAVARGALDKVADRLLGPLSAPESATTVLHRLAALDHHRPRVGMVQRAALGGAAMAVLAMVTSTALIAASGHHGLAGVLSLCGL